MVTVRKVTGKGPDSSSGCVSSSYESRTSIIVDEGKTMSPR